MLGKRKQLLKKLLLMALKDKYVEYTENDEIMSGVESLEEFQDIAHSTLKDWQANEIYTETIDDLTYDD